MVSRWPRLILLLLLLRRLWWPLGLNLLLRWIVLLKSVVGRVTVVLRLVVGLLGWSFEILIENYKVVVLGYILLQPKVLATEANQFLTWSVVSKSIRSCLVSL